MFQLLYGLLLFIFGVALVCFIGWLALVVLGVWGISGLIIFILILILLK